MMKQRVHITVAAMAFALAATTAVPHASYGQAAFPTLARGYTAWLVRAFDQCAAGTITLASNLGACPQTNIVTDNTLGMRFARLRVTHGGNVGIFGTGFTVGDSLRVRLVLRVTKAGVTGSAGKKTTTFADVTANCPVVTARPNGAIAKSTPLSSCLTPNTALAAGNIEIVSAALINTANGKAVGVPGILR